MGFVVSKSKSDQKQRKKSGLGINISRNRNASNRSSATSVKQEFKGRSITVKPQISENLMAETVDQMEEPASRHDSEVKGVKFERKWSSTAWTNAGETIREAQTADIKADRVEASTSTWTPEVSKSVLQDTRKVTGNDELEIHDLDEEDRITEGGRVSQQQFQDCGRPSMFEKSGPVASGGEGSGKRIDERFHGAPGDKGGQSFESFVPNPPTDMTKFMAPHMCNMIITGHLGGDNDLPRQLRMPDIELVARGDSQVKPLDGFERVTITEKHLEVYPKAEFVHNQDVYEESFQAGKSEGSYYETDRKSITDHWPPTTYHFCSCSDSCPARADCGGDFVCAFSGEPISPKTKRHLDCAANFCDFSDREILDFAIGSIDECCLVQPSHIEGASDPLGACMMSDAKQIKHVTAAMLSSALFEQGVEFQRRKDVDLSQDGGISSPYEAPDKENPARNDMGKVDIEEIPARDDTEDQEDSLSAYENIYDASPKKQEFISGNPSASPCTADHTPVSHNQADIIYVVEQNANFETTSPDIEDVKSGCIGKHPESDEDKSDRGDCRGQLPDEATIVIRGRSTELKDLNTEECNDIEMNGVIVGASIMDDESLAPEEHLARSSKTFGQEKSDEEEHSVEEFFGQKMSHRGHSLP